MLTWRVSMKRWSQSSRKYASLVRMPCRAVVLGAALTANMACGARDVHDEASANAVTCDEGLGPAISQELESAQTALDDAQAAIDGMEGQSADSSETAGLVTTEFSLGVLQAQPTKPSGTDVEARATK